MILDFIIHAMVVFITAVLGILPNVPATPAGVTAGATWITDQITSVIAFLNLLYSPTLLAAILIIVVGMFNFEWIYHTALWIIRKIPMINVS
jgi:hypothetical protein